MKKLLGLFVCALLLGGLLVSQAGAFSLDVPFSGRLQFIFQNFDSGTTGYPIYDAQGNLLPSGTVVGDTPYFPPLPAPPNGVPDCDTAAGAGIAPNSDPNTSVGFGVTGSGTPYLPGTAQEDSWAIFDVAQIKAGETIGPVNEGDTLWTAGLGNNGYLTGYFHHVVDHYVVTTRDAFGIPGFLAQSVGGQIEMFWDADGDYSGGAGPAGRNGFGTYGAGATYGYPGSAADDGSEGDLFLAMNLSPGVQFGDPLYTTFVSTYFFGVAQGTGKGFADINPTLLSSGGIPGGLFAPNIIPGTEQDVNGGFHDFAFDFTTAIPSGGSWTVTSAGQGFVTATVPEPASMLLVGSGLLGLAGLGRRRFFRK